MISLLIYHCDEKEKAVIKKMSSKIVAYDSDEKLDILEDIDPSIVPNLAIVNICGPEGIDAMHRVREAYGKVEIMLISDVKVSPMQYLNPVIHPLSLVIAPYSEEELQKTLREFIGMMFTASDGEIWVDGYNGKTKVSLASILYVEAKNKMLNIRLESVEYSIYGTLEQFLAKLPGYFKRCHRAVVVNTRYIQSVRFSENYIKLNNGEMVPLSRSCKQDFKEMIK